MDVAQYRKRVEEQVKRSRKPAAKSRAARALRAPKGSKQRIAAIDALTFEGKDAARRIEELIALLGDRGEPLALRQAALRALKTASFLGPRFAPHRAAFLRCLRALATDPEPELRIDALETLALERVEDAKPLLLAGLRDPKKALVPAAKAIQLLGADGHAEAAPVVRRLLKRAADLPTREAAVRFLAGDPGARKALGDVLKDRGQPAALRALSASAVRQLDPAGFERTARKIVADNGEDDALRASCLGALTFVKHFRKSRGDQGFLDQVARLHARSRSKPLRQAAQRFLAQRGGGG